MIVHAGIDRVTGCQRQIARQVKGKREAERLEAMAGVSPIPASSGQGTRHR